MSHRDEMDRIFTETTTWSTDERLVLADRLYASVGKRPASPAPADKLTDEEWEAKRQAFKRLAGSLVTDKPAPTDEEVEKSYSDYLMKKYA